MPLHAPEYIRTLVPYVPGKPIEETQRELKIRRVIKLASNENPLGPSPKALQAIRRVLSTAHRYPDASGYGLKHALAAKNGLPPEQFILGNGSEEIMDLMIRAYCVPGDAIVTSQAAFIAYKISAQIQGMHTYEAPLTADFRFDLSAMARLVRDHDRVRIVFVANPNNPTGTYCPVDEVRAFLREVRSVRDGSVLVALDSAYWEYVTARDLPDPMELQREFPNVLVMRTFSKIYGLAGLRAGYGIASREIIATLEKVRKPFNLNSLALVAAQAALSDTAFVARSRKLNEQGRRYWEKELKRLGLPFWPSQGNFVLVDTGRGLGKSGGEVFQECLRHGVIFRPVTNYGLLHALRISFGTMEENRVAVRTLEKVVSAKGLERGRKNGHAQGGDAKLIDPDAQPDRARSRAASNGSKKAARRT
jgi:histidinol-phosphate aminotransferase